MSETSYEGITIPAGKRLRIHQGNTSVVNVPMVLDEPVTVSLSSTFEPLIKSGGSKAVDILGALSSQFTGGGVAFGGQLKQFGLHLWEGTEPVNLNVTVTFRVDKTNVDGKSQVLIPATRLMAIPLPAYGSFGSGGGGLSGVLDFMASQTLVPPGPTIANVIDIEGTNLSGYNTYTIEVGKFLRINQAIIKKAEPTFATETDSLGYPMWVKINLDIQSIYTATVNEVIGSLGLGV